MKHIVILTTGGTIAMRADAQAGGAVPALAGTDFSAALPSGLAEIRTEEFSNLPSAHFTLNHIWSLSRRVAALVADDAVDGIVVTHGTDTLEESAYLCDITINTSKPIVFTGAMRTASEIGYEGFANLAGAVQVAASDDARGTGALVVFNDEIHAARDVTKTHTTALDAFKSPGFGALGRVDYGVVVIGRKPTRREFIPATRLEANVHLLKLVVGMSDGLLEYLAETVGARGVVLETLGGGRVPPAWLPTIERVIRNGCAIVITSRTGTGRTIDRYGYVGSYRDLVRLGCWFAEGQNGQKARIKLMVALGAGDAQKYFARE
ncbi:MAG: asparaginase [Chloroflexota bacterium]|nr:asparaginase [Chloroflexota bacterium]